MKAWEDAGLDPVLLEDGGTAMATQYVYGSSTACKFEMGGQPVLVMVFDLKKLGAKAEEFLTTIEEKEAYPRTGDGVEEPHYRNKEMTLSGLADEPLDEHPQLEEILKVFKAVI